MTHDTRGANSHVKLASAVERASEGETVIVASEAAKELGEEARVRMCPDKKLAFEVRPVF